MTTIGERIKEIRKAKHLTQQAFADELGLKRNTVGGYEIATVTPSERTIADICKTYRVNESWLRTGEGEMFLQASEEDELADLFAEIIGSPKDDKVRQLAVKYKRLTPKQRHELAEILLELGK